MGEEACQDVKQPMPSQSTLMADSGLDLAADIPDNDVRGVVQLAAVVCPSQAGERR
jgi:hypothetical protein